MLIKSRPVEQKYVKGKTYNHLAQLSMVVDTDTNIVVWLVEFRSNGFEFTKYDEAKCKFDNLDGLVKGD